MIYDAFLFSNELDLLEIRLNELKDVVDRFVLLEASRTFTNQPKPLVFKENRSRFSAFLDRIIHIEISRFDSIDMSDAWKVEHHMRRCLALGLRYCQPDDVILLSDVDELPRPEIVRREAARGDISTFVYRISYYFVNCVGGEITCTTMFPYRYLKEVSPDLQYFRRIESRRVSEAGRHLSYLGGIAAIREKIGAFAHTECNRPEFTDPHYLAECLAGAKDLFGRQGEEFDYHIVPLDHTFPRTIVANQDRYAHLIAPVPERNGGDSMIRNPAVYEADR